MTPVGPPGRLETGKRKEAAMEIVTTTERPHPLTNEGHLDLFFLGTGSAFADSHYQTNLLIIKQDLHLLVDFGTVGPVALRAVAGLAPTTIETLLLTHAHADHVGGVECLALMNRYVGRRFLNREKLRLVTTPEFATLLWNETLRGGLAYNERMATGEPLALSDFFELIEATPLPESEGRAWSVELPCGGGATLKLLLLRTCHIPEQAHSWRDAVLSYALLIDDRVFYSGDTQYDPELLETWAQGAEVILHDVQFFPGGVHAPLAELAALPEAIKAKTYLLHYADNWQDQILDGFAGWVQQGVTYRFPK